MTPDSPLSALLDSVYELEGLIHLALNRDTPPSTLSSLICRKAEVIAAMAPDACASLDIENLSEEDALSPDMPAPEEETASLKEDEILSSEAESPQEEDTPEFIPMETVSPDYELGEEYSESSDFVASESAPQQSAEASSVTPSVSSSAAPKRGRLVFNLNDRYRFRRSLFHGNDADFSAALSSAADAASYADAESYFYSVLGWNPEDEEVMAFMQLLENYYK